MSTYGVLLDTAGIQRFIFSSNKLKDNVGASKIVDGIYREALAQATGLSVDELDDWKKSADTVPVVKPGKCAVAFIGGGNALLVAATEEEARQLVRDWSSRLLVEAPGVQLVAAIGPLDPGSPGFRQQLDALFETMARNKNSGSLPTAIPLHGVTAICARSGRSLDVRVPETGGISAGFVSSGSSAKMRAAREVKNGLDASFAEELGSGFCFADSFEGIGHTHGDESRMAVVHVDGNAMGERFKNQRDLAGIRRLSDSVQDAVRKSFKELLAAIIKGWSGYGQEITPRKYGGKTVLPILPIIIGGDDVTFVCPGRLGIDFARIFVESLEKQKVSDGKTVAACVGVAIVKAKFPFYRAYRLAEELCSSAKNAARTHGGSWLDFHIASGGRSGSLAEIREWHYSVAQGCLLNRPYCLTAKGGKPDFAGFVRETAALCGGGVEGKGLPNSKLHELREVLAQDAAAGARFILEQQNRGRLREAAYQSLFEERRTRFFDMIELTELYPKFRLEAEVGND